MAIQLCQKHLYRSDQQKVRALFVDRTNEFLTLFVTSVLIAFLICIMWRLYYICVWVFNVQSPVFADAMRRIAYVFCSNNSVTWFWALIKLHKVVAGLRSQNNNCSLIQCSSEYTQNFFFGSTKKKLHHVNLHRAIRNAQICALKPFMNCHWLFIY